MNRAPRTAIAAVAALLGACSATPRTPVATVGYVDLPRFMGDWYVIACIPTRIERGAHNAVESYRLDPQGRIATTFRFRAGSFDGPEKVYRPTGYIRDRGSNAVWGMQFIWPIKADFRISYLDPDYSLTVIGRAARDHAWIMARQPRIAAADYARLVELLRAQGYDLARLQRVPQRWPAPEAAP
jgi:apolipoprotein D and lipocalin family protein